MKDFFVKKKFKTTKKNKQDKKLSRLQAMKIRVRKDIEEIGRAIKKNCDSVEERLETVFEKFMPSIDPELPPMKRPKYRLPENISSGQPMP